MLFNIIFAISITNDCIIDNVYTNQINIFADTVTTFSSIIIENLKYFVL